MTRNLKAFGLALAAIFALGAVMAAGASAAGETFHSEVEPTIITAESTGKQVFTAGSFNVTCEHGTFRGTSLNKTENTLTLHPTYSECETSLGGGASVDTTGCNYVFGSETNASGDLPTSIECTTGFSIKVTASGCTLSFGAQNTTGGVKVTNTGSGSTRDVDVEATSTATFSKSGSLCFVISGTTGKYTGPSTVKGFVDNGVDGPIDETNESGEDVTATYTEGAQVGIWWE